MGLYRGNDQRFCNKVSRDIVVICQDNQTLHDVLEFSGISWPVMGIKMVDALWFDALDVLLKLLIAYSEEVIHQDRNILTPFS